MTRVVDIYAQCLHPSGFIRDEMVSRNWDVDRLAVAMSQHGGRPPGEVLLMLEVYSIVGPTSKKMRMGTHMAKMLAGAFGVSVNFWQNIERAWLDDPSQPHIKPNPKVGEE